MGDSIRLIAMGVFLAGVVVGAGSVVVAQRLRAKGLGDFVPRPGLVISRRRRR